MAKKPYDFVDLSLQKERELELEKREDKIKPIRFKICSKCGETKLIFKFSVDKRNSDGRMGVCKACRCRQSLKHYYENRDKILIRAKEYQDTHKRDRSKYFENYQGEHKEHLKKVAKSWYKKNKEAIKERNLKYYNENKEACNIRRANWIKNNKEKIRKYNQEYHKLKVSLKLKGD